MRPTRVLHLAAKAEWRRAQGAEGLYRGSTKGADLAEVGFVHAATAAQLPAVVAAAYADVDLDDYVLLVVDAAACAEIGSEVRWEAPAGGGPPFPHVYGPLPTGAVVAALPVSRGADGALQLPALDGFDVARDPPPG